MSNINCLTYTIPEAAQRVGASPQLFYKLAAAGKLPGLRRIGEKRLVVIKSVFEEAFLAGVGEGRDIQTALPRQRQQSGKSSN